jgi:hypothetical protein
MLNSRRMRLLGWRMAGKVRRGKGLKIIFKLGIIKAGLES